jgi:hypothetical protein
MHKNATKCNETLSKWCKNKHGASKIIDMFETYQLPVLGLPIPQPVIGCWLGSPVVKLLLFFIDLSMISSQKTPGGIGGYWDPMFAKLSASSLLALLMCETLHPLNVPSR